MSDSTGRYRFSARDDAQGHPFIDVQRRGGEDTLGGHVHLNCPPGTSYEDAAYVAQLLNRSVVSVTRIDTANSPAQHDSAEAAPH